MSNEDKDLDQETELDGTFDDETCLTKGGQENIDEAIQVFEETSYFTVRHNAETGGTEWKKTDPPEFRNITAIKRSFPDYQPGKVRVYTKEEIEEYELQHNASD